MSLNLADKNLIREFTACDTVFKVRSLSITEKETLLRDIENINNNNEEELFDTVIKLVTDIMIEIVGYDAKPYDVLSKLEDVKQLKEIVNALIDHCKLTDEEAKN